MSDAYLFAMVLGLRTGEKVESGENKKTYANISTIEGDWTFIR